MKVGLYDKLLTVEELNQLKKDAATVCGHSAEPQLSELLYGGAQLLSQIYADKLLALQDSLSNKDAKEQQELLKQQATQLLFAMLQAAQALPSQFPSTPLQQLLAVSATPAPLVLPQGLTTRTVARPHYPLAINHLFAGNKGPNELLAELKEECYSADSIDLIVSFIKWSGYLKLKQALHSFTERGGKLRILTTTYVGNTDAKALLALSKLPNTIIKVCYDSKRVRLHAKSYIFRRQSGFGSAYVGSANLTSPALTSGVEWNVKIAQAQDAQVFEQICSAFEYFFASETFEEFTGTEAQMNRLEEALRLEKGGLKAQTEEADMSFFNLQPYYFQQQILDKLQAQRELNNSWRNLVVAATGTGKTVIAAFDFKRFYQHMLRTEKREARLLFIVPRIEIAKQALGTFRQVLRDQNFGDLLSGENHPASPAQLFAVIDSVNSRALPEHLPSDYYDYVVLDEVHHAAAMSYQRVLSHFKPKILLGLTATP